MKRALWDQIYSWAATQCLKSQQPQHQNKSIKIIKNCTRTWLKGTELTRLLFLGISLRINNFQKEIYLKVQKQMTCKKIIIMKNCNQMIVRSI